MLREINLVVQGAKEIHNKAFIWQIQQFHITSRLILDINIATEIASLTSILNHIYNLKKESVPRKITAKWRELKSNVSTKQKINNV